MTINAIDTEIHGTPQADGRSPKTVIIGAGLAGLSCAKRLCERNIPIVVLEASERVGGRVRTDRVDGFTLDHGFQVLLTAYPACRELLDYKALRLRPFEPGALVRNNGRFARLGDPWRRPMQAVSTAMSPVGSLTDKLKIAKLRAQASSGTLNDLYQRPSQTTQQRLKDIGFSEAMIDQFFRPFLGGVFLDESLSTSSRMLEFVFRMFAAGDIAIPADGMAAIPRQLAEGLARGTLRLNSTVRSIEPSESGHRVRLTDATHLEADSVVVATESNAAAKLLQTPELVTQWNHSTTMYYSCRESPQPGKFLMLRGDESGPIQTAVVLSDVAPEYASQDRALISVSISDSMNQRPADELDSAVRQQAKHWFGPSADHWELVQTIRTPYGLPRIDLDPVLQSVRGDQIPGLNETTGIYVCGDHRESPSIQGAMNSGLRVAEQILATR